MVMPRLAFRLCTATALGALTLSLLSACASTVALEPAEDANNPACAEFSVRLPDYVAGEQRRWTNAQATGAWGEPSKAIASCGLALPAPSQMMCQTVAGNDWLVDDSKAPQWRFVSYNRDPAVEVLVDYEQLSGVAVLTDLAPAVSALPLADQRCIERVEP